MTQTQFETRYLGDGVYASFDGYQIWLHVGAHTNPPVVALEPEVLKALNDYWAAIQIRIKHLRSQHD